jgi:hypothetical protein
LKHILSLVRPPGPGAYVRGRSTVAAAKHACEIRQISKPDVEGRGGDRPIEVADVGENSIGQRQPLLDHVSGKRRALGPEQHLHVAGCDALARGDVADAEPLVVEPRRDIGLDGVEPRRRQAAALSPLINGGVLSK